MSADVDHVTDAEIVSFDDAKARSTLRKVDAAITKWIGSTVDLADLCHEAQRDQCWRVDEDYRAGLSGGAIAPPDDTKGRSHARNWLGWKFNRSGRTAEQLADYGELRAILAVDCTLPNTAEPEATARKMVAKLLHAKLLGREVEDPEARAEAIREAWRIATARTEGDIRAAMTEVLRPVVLKQIKYRPIRRLAEPKPPEERARIRRQKIDRAARQFLKRGHDLINLGAVDRFDDALAELTEARGRWTPT